MANHVHNVIDSRVEGQIVDVIDSRVEGQSFYSTIYVKTNTYLTISL